MSNNKSCNYTKLKLLIRDFFLEARGNNMKDMKDEICKKYGISERHFDDLFHIIRETIKKGGTNGQYVIDADPQNLDTNPLYELYGLKNYKVEGLIRYVILLYAISSSRNYSTDDIVGKLEDIFGRIKQNKQKSSPNKSSQKSDPKGSDETKNLKNEFEKINQIFKNFINIKEEKSQLQKYRKQESQKCITHNEDFITFDKIWHSNQTKIQNKLTDDQIGLIDYLTICSLTNPFGYFATNIKKYLLITYSEDKIKNSSKTLQNYQKPIKDELFREIIQFPNSEDVFRVINVFFATALEEGLMCRLVQSMHNGKLVRFACTTHEQENCLYRSTPLPQKAQPIKLLSSLKGGKIYCIFFDPDFKNITDSIFYIRVDYITELHETDEDCLTTLESNTLANECPEFAEFKATEENKDNTSLSSKSSYSPEKFQKFRSYLLKNHITWGSRATGKSPKDSVEITFQIPNEKIHAKRKLFREKRNGEIEIIVDQKKSNKSVTTYIYKTTLDDANEMQSWLKMHMGQILDIKVNNQPCSKLAYRYWDDLRTLTTYYNVSLNNVPNILQNYWGASNINASNNIGINTSNNIINNAPQLASSTTNEINENNDEELAFYNKYRSTDYYDLLSFLALKLQIKKLNLTNLEVDLKLTKNLHNIDNIEKYLKGILDNIGQNSQLQLSNFDNFKIPLTDLEQRWLMSALNDKRALLYLSEEYIDNLKKLLSQNCPGRTPLYTEEDFAFYDLEGSEDINKTGSSNISIEREILNNINAANNKSFLNLHKQCVQYCKEQKFIQIEYVPIDSNESLTKTVLPLNVEYSRKNDLTRLRAIHIIQTLTNEQKNLSKLEYKYIEILIHTIKSINTVNEGLFAQLPDFNSYEKALEKYNKNKSEDALYIEFKKNKFQSRDINIAVIEFCFSSSDTRNTESRFLTEFSDYVKFSMELKNKTYIALLYPCNAKKTVFLKLLSFGSTIGLPNLGDSHNYDDLLTNITHRYKAFLKDNKLSKSSQPSRSNQGQIKPMQKISPVKFSTKIRENQDEARKWFNEKITEQLQLIHNH